MFCFFINWNAPFKVAFGYSSLKGAIARDASFFHIKKLNIFLYEKSTTDIVLEDVFLEDVVLENVVLEDVVQEDVVLEDVVLENVVLEDVVLEDVVLEVKPIAKNNYLRKKTKIFFLLSVCNFFALRKI